MDPNNTNFSLSITELFKKLDSSAVLKSHQNLVVNYAADKSLLIQHDLGTGKSLIAAAILANSSNKQVIFLSAKSLHDNMQKAINQYEQLSKSTITTKYNYVTMNASNMLTQLNKITLGNFAAASGKTLDEKFGIASNINLNNMVLIVDEAHNLFNSITNGSKNAVGLYHSIMNSNVKVIFLSGTPIVNHPFELVPCFNMISRTELFPPNWDDFNKFFVDMKNKRIKNKAKYQNRITGLISYYGDKYGIKNKTDFPDSKQPEIIHCPMSSLQFSVYKLARDIEMQESKGIGSSVEVLQKPRGVFTSSYRRLSRQFSNFGYPNTALDIDGKFVKIHSSKITHADLKSLDKYSPKLKTLSENLLKDGGKSLVYSSFVENAGINIIAKILELHNITEYNTDAPDNIQIKKHAKSPSYVKITGDVIPEDRFALIDIFNSDKNLHGDIIKIILVSGAGAEGLDLKAVRNVHITEPYWNWMRIKQVIGRAVRYKSHDQLPKNLRNVRTRIYASDYPKNVDATKYKSEKTTDLTLLESSQSLYTIIEQFYAANAEAAIDCTYHNKNSKLNCRLCTPTNEQLYITDIYRDMNIRSPCKPMEYKDVDAKEIIYNDIKYAYDNDNIYEWNDNLGGYVEMHLNNPLYSQIYKQIKK